MTRMILLGLAASWIVCRVSAKTIRRALDRGPRFFWPAYWSGLGARIVVFGALALLSLGGPRRLMLALLFAYAGGIVVWIPWEARLLSRSREAR